MEISGITLAPCVLNQDVANGFTGDEDDRVAVFCDLLVTLAGDCRRCNQDRQIAGVAAASSGAESLYRLAIHLGPEDPRRVTLGL